MTHVRAVVSAFVDSIGFDATMSDLLKNTSVSIWHAFNALQQIQNVSVHKSKLKVIFSYFYLSDEFYKFIVLCVEIKRGFTVS